ncbi:DNA repair protein RecN [Bacteroidetes bacterium SCGC AAA795-G10]|nr:DNA repair protein RecN [Bacteroidetes bacterium SCGC AAA795-G10]
MLTKLKIKNFAIIEDLEVDFSEGMTCITGETGTGKSILLGGLSLVLGKRADLSNMFDSSRKCIVEAVFQINQYTLKPLFDKYDLDYYDETVLRREILPHGKSRAFVNDTPVNLNLLEKISLNLIDIHSQNDTQTLLENEYQIEVLDALAGNEELLKKYQNTLISFKNCVKEYEELHFSQSHVQKAFELDRFLLEELNSSKLEIGMQEELEENINELSSVEYLQKTIANSIQMIELESFGLLDKFKELVKNINGIYEKSKKFEDLNNRVGILSIELEDILESLKSQFEMLETNPEKLNEFNLRIDHLNSLYQKHKVKNVDDLIFIKQKLEKTIYNNSKFEENLLYLEKKQKNLENTLRKYSSELSFNRKKTISILEKELKLLVTKMGMDQATFKIQLDKGNEFYNNGTDEISFMFSANRGSDFKTLKKVVSGGELSRIMLAIKAILSQYKKLPTLVFDEIDTGVSGKISSSIAEVMGTISTKLQVFTITHLPQVAAKGNHHFRVEKKLDNGKTKTFLEFLNHKSRIEEIAKMLSGNKVTKSAIEHAKQLMN